MMKALLAELVGTFILVFIGSMAVVTSNNNVVVSGLAHGLVLVGLVGSYGSVSGGHFNPAVTISMLVSGHINPVKALFYILVQLGGGIAAAFVLVAILPNPGNYGQTVGSLTSANVVKAAVLEAVLTFILVSAIFQTAAPGRAGAAIPVTIGFTLAACILAAGDFTGGSLNPARTFGPALAAGDLSYFAPYVIGQLVGGALSGLIHRFVISK